MLKKYFIWLSLIISLTFILTGCKTENEPYSVSYKYPDYAEGLSLETTLFVANNKVYKQELTYITLYSYVEGVTTKEEAMNSFEPMYTNYFNNIPGLVYKSTYNDENFTIKFTLAFDEFDTTDTQRSLIGVYKNENPQSIYAEFSVVEDELIQNGWMKIE